MTKYPEEFLSSDFLASSMNINPVLVRKEVANLKKNSLVECREGKNGGSKLAVAAKNLTLEDIFKITFESVNLGYCKNDPNPQCPVGQKINQNLDSLYNDINKGISKKLSQISLSEFTGGF